MKLNVYYYFSSIQNELSSLKQYFDKIESLIVQESNFVKTNLKELNDVSELDYCSDPNIKSELDLILIDRKYPDEFRSYCIARLYTLFEINLNRVCLESDKWIEKEKLYLDSVDEKEKLLSKIKQHIKLTINKNISDFKRWNDIHAFKLIRHKIIHNRNWISDEEKHLDSVRQIVKKTKGLELLKESNSEFYRITFKGKDSVDCFVQLIQEFFQFLKRLYFEFFDDLDLAI